ncbi:MAG: hypothetical protein Q4D91_01305 [Lautropia sp.]|nr:hypothetical protein [Lautropia sp.]
MRSSSHGSSRVRPYLVTSADAARLPRWIPLLFCAVYVFAGLFGRDPWRTDDAIGFGIAHTMATGSTIDWLLPNVHGVLVAEGGPLPFWLGAIGMQVAHFLNALASSLFGRMADPWLISPDLALRMTAALGIAMAMVLLWYAARNLARRPEIQPQDPFGAGVSPNDFGHAVADASLLALLACFGLIAPIHETTANAAQLPWVALYLFGLSMALDRPRTGGLLVGVSVAAGLLTYGAPLALMLTLALFLLCWLVTPYRLVAGWILLTAVPVMLIGSIVWPAMLAYYSNPDSAVQALPMMAGDSQLPLDPAARLKVAEYLDAWLHWNRQLLGLATPESLLRYVNTMPWYFWPMWPFVIWGVWRWRGGCREAPIAAALFPLATLLFVALLNPSPTDHQHMLTPMVMPMAILTGITLPMIRRNLVSVVDWFAVMIFSVVGLAVWAYWIAFMTGWPPRMAAKAQAAVPGFSASLSWVELGIGLAATLAWLLLVIWRVSRRPRPFWRPMALSSGGMVLSWLLLMTLWLPAGNYRKSYQEMLTPTRALFASRPGCTLNLALDAGEVALFAYHGGARFIRLPELRQQENPSPPPVCPWLVVADERSRPANLADLLEQHADSLPVATDPGVIEAGNWRQLWQGYRPASRTGHRLTLYVRNPLAPMK